MTQFIKIPSKAPFDMDIFKSRYLELTGEKIQDSPMINDVNTHILVGSSRLTQDVGDQLATEYPLISITQTIPVDWVTKDELL